jgi:multiple sugar transport system ATP-binding protein
VGSIQIRNLTKRYTEDVVAVHDLSLSIEDGEFMVLVGPSGCGKTTLLRMIAGLEQASGGEIAISGHDVVDVDPGKRDIAMVFQNYALYPHMTVRQNLGFGLKMARLPKDEIAKRVDEVGKMLALDGLFDRKPKALSGGQRQRVAMGRAIVRKPAAFLMDEPLSNLDAKLRVTLRAELARLHAELGVTTVYVTHDQIEAMTLGQRVAIMSEGHLLQCGPPEELFETPATTFVAAFMGSPGMNLVQAVVLDKTVSLGQKVLPVPDSLRAVPDGNVTLGIRPNDFEIAGPHVDPSLPRMAVEITGVENLGSERRLFFEVAARPGPESGGVNDDDLESPGHLFTARDHTVMTASVRPTVRVSPGEQVELAIDNSRIHLFDSESGVRLGPPAAAPPKAEQLVAGAAKR